MSQDVITTDIVRGHLPLSYAKAQEVLNLLLLHHGYVNTV